MVNRKETAYAVSWAVWVASARAIGNARICHLHFFNIALFDWAVDTNFIFERR
jgi:hypothetical protein